MQQAPEPQDTTHLHMQIRPEHRQELEARGSMIQSLQAEAARLVEQAKTYQRLAQYSTEALNALLEREYNLSAIGEKWQIDLIRGLLVYQPTSPAEQVQSKHDQ